MFVLSGRGGRGGLRQSRDGDHGEPGQLCAGARPSGGPGQVQDHPGQEGDGQRPVPHVFPPHGERGWEKSVPIGREEKEKVSNFKLSDVD